MSDLLADTLRLILRRLDALESREDRVLETLRELITHVSENSGAPPRAPTRPRPRESAQAILDEVVSHVAAYYEAHGQPMQFYRFAGGFAKRWSRQTDRPETLKNAVASDPRLKTILAQSGGTLFVPRDAYDRADVVTRLAWGTATKSSLDKERASVVDAAARFAPARTGSQDSPDSATSALTDAPDAFALDEDADEG